MVLGLPYLHDKIKKCRGHLNAFEPVRRAGRYYDHVSLGEQVRFAAVNSRPTDFFRRRYFRVNDLAASDKGCGPVDNIKNVGVPGMKFRFTRRVVLATDDLVVAAVAGNKCASLVECCFDIGAGEISHFLGRRWGRSRSRGRRLAVCGLRTAYGSQAEDSKGNHNNFKKKLSHIRYSSG